MARAKRTAVAAGPVEGPWELPKGWRWERLGDLGNWYGGGTPSKANAAFWTGGSVPWVSAKDMKSLYIDDAEDKITDDAVLNSAAKRIPAGSVVCVMRSGILKHSFPVAVTRREVTINQDLRALHPRPDVDPAFLAYYLRRTANDVLHECSKDGTTVNSIEAGRLMQRPVPVPGLGVQRRIVARIEELFAEIGEGERALAEATFGLSGHRKALLHAAFTGELTADTRRGLQDVRVVSNAPDPEEEDEDVTISAIPSSWDWRSLGELFSINVGATPSRRDPNLWRGSVPWVSSGEVAFCRIRTTREQISEAAVSPDRVHPPGTVLLGMIGEGKTRGQAAILDIAAAHNQNCASIRVSGTAIPPEYVYWWLEHRYEATRADGAGGNQPALNKARVARIRMPLPPQAELLEIVRRLTAAFAADEAAAEPVHACSHLPATLRQSILTAAFRGDLVA